MSDEVFLLRMKYGNLFGIQIPNEPCWPGIVLENSEKFERLLRESVQKKIDFLTKEYGPGWAEQDDNKLY